MDSLTKATAVSRETLAPGTALQGINSLPDEILIEIFSYLGLCDLPWCAHTCRRWRAILQEKKSLWRGYKCSTFEAEKIREVLAVAGAMPRFETLSLRFSNTFGIEIAWPVATIFDNSKNTLPTWEPYFRCFDTECLVIRCSVRNNIFFHLLWVDRLTLRRLVILQNCPFPTPYTDSSADPFRVASNACNPVQWMRDARRDLFSGRGCHGTAEVTSADSGTDGALCPALEEIEVSGEDFGSEQLEELCSLGPVRTLRMRCWQGPGLKCVRRCQLTLEELELRDCQYLQEGAFADLLCLERLRVLHLCHTRNDVEIDDYDPYPLFAECVKHNGTVEVATADSGTEGAVCPALEEVKVSSKDVWSDQLEEVCSLGPVRTLLVRCRQDLGLTFVRHCRTTLEELELWDCQHLPEGAFADLLSLERLRVLHLSDSGDILEKIVNDAIFAEDVTPYGILSGRGCRHSGTAEVTAADSRMGSVVCAALEEVKVSSYYVWSDQLEEVCSLGPVRTLHVNCGWHEHLKFVRRSRKTLEELELWDCQHLSEDAFADLLCLERLRVLRLSDCRVEGQTVGRYVAGLPCLKTCLVNGCDVLPQCSS